MHIFLLLALLSSSLSLSIVGKVASGRILFNYRSIVAFCDVLAEKSRTENWLKWSLPSNIDDVQVCGKRTRV